jgi:hypothetical protein
MSGSTYIFIFEDNTVATSTKPPTAVDFECIAGGTLEVIKVEGRCFGVECEGIVFHLPECQLIEDQDGGYHAP